MSSRSSICVELSPHVWRSVGAVLRQYWQLGPVDLGSDPIPEAHLAAALRAIEPVGVIADPEKITRETPCGAE